MRPGPFTLRFRGLLLVKRTGGFEPAVGGPENTAGKWRTVRTRRPLCIMPPASGSPDVTEGEDAPFPTPKMHEERCGGPWTAATASS